MERYTPQNLVKWTRPDCYMGASWPEYYSAGFGRSRDSDCLEESNFEAVLAALDSVEYDEDEWDGHSPYLVVSENHWAVGWVEWIAIHEDAEKHLMMADSLREAANDYPVIDESDYCERESEAANRVWSDCYYPSERIEYIRKFRDQFHFHNFAELLAVVRGEYFNGYASDLLY